MSNRRQSGPYLAPRTGYAVAGAIGGGISNFVKAYQQARMAKMKGQYMAQQAASMAQWRQAQAEGLKAKYAPIDQATAKLGVLLAARKSSQDPAMQKILDRQISDAMSGVVGSINDQDTANYVKSKMGITPTPPSGPTSMGLPTQVSGQAPAAPVAPGPQAPDASIGPLSYSGAQYISKMANAGAMANRMEPIADANRYSADRKHEAYLSGLQAAEQRLEQTGNQKQFLAEMNNIAKKYGADVAAASRIKVAQIGAGAKTETANTQAGATIGAAKIRAGASNYAVDNKVANGKSGKGGGLSAQDRSALEQLKSYEKQSQYFQKVIQDPAHGISDVVLTDAQKAQRVKSAQDGLAAVQAQKDSLFKQYPNIAPAASQSPSQPPSLSGQPPKVSLDRDSLLKAPVGALVDHPQKGTLQKLPDGTWGPAQPAVPQPATPPQSQVYGPPLPPGMPDPSQSIPINLPPEGQ